MAQVRLIGVCFLVVALASGVISTALDYWYMYYLSATAPGNTGSIYFGLWEFCTKSGDKHACISWSDIEDGASAIKGLAVDTDWLHGCQAMIVIGVIQNAVALLAAVIAIGKHIPARVAQIASCVAGIFYIIAAVIFGAKYEGTNLSSPDGGSLHAGFGLAIVAGIFGLVPTCLLCISPSGDYTYKNSISFK